ncbi:hypothetical protein DMN91_002220 [Ooceraea biroi]|uniref:Uncharacterized protein n=2 Tax=Ooceraea biroi TaxID=2015173 RepID=A0A026WCP3_OOCBI|nr:hypothetical protein X777_08131 [Ooceraea biroi]RLU26057.1 hypothetical protein DMN91_002220 [Ooceraea biroi]
MLVILQLAIAICSAVSGLIWCKEKQEFVEIFSIPQFAALQKENVIKSDIEIHDMKNEVIRAVYYEEKNLVMFTDNDTKITGIYGDLWYLLADYLNFTFIPVKTISRSFGERLKNGSFTGLLDILENNEIQVILRSEFFSSRMNDVDYTTPLWKSKFYIYVQPEWQYDNTWVVTLFSKRTLYCIIFLFIIMSYLGYFLQNVPKSHEIERKRKDSEDYNLNDHFFHSFAMMCSQGYIPDAFYNKFKILSLSKSIFAWLVMLSFNSNLIYRMTNRESLLSFNDLDTLFNNTKYTLLVFRGSSFYDLFQDTYAIDNNVLDRVRFLPTSEDMYNEICNNLQKYVMLELKDQYMALSRSGCPLVATGDYNEVWITFALKKNFPYKKPIDAGIIKLNEVGLMDCIIDRWLNIRLETTKDTTFKTIDFNQVYLIFLILYCGVLLSLTILVLENIIHYHEKKKNEFRRRK